MLQKIFKYGVIAGLTVGIPLSVITLAVGERLPQAMSMALGYLIMLVALSAVFVAIKRHRDRALGGVIRFWPALGLGLGISFVAGLFYVAAWEVAVALSGIDFATVFADAMIEQEKAKGTSAEALARFTADMEQFRIAYANPLYRMPMTFAEIFPVGLLVSLISATLLRNSRFLPARPH